MTCIAKWGWPLFLLPILLFSLPEVCEADDGSVSAQGEFQQKISKKFSQISITLLPHVPASNNTTPSFELDFATKKKFYYGDLVIRALDEFCSGEYSFSVMFYPEKGVQKVHYFKQASPWGKSVNVELKRSIELRDNDSIEVTINGESMIVKVANHNKLRWLSIEANTGATIQSVNVHKTSAP